jgi:hypothetical protein
MVYGFGLLAGLCPGEVAALCWRHYHGAAGQADRRAGVQHAKAPREDDEDGCRASRAVHPTLAAMLAEWRPGGWAEMMGREPEPDDPIVPLPPRPSCGTAAAPATLPRPRLLGEEVARARHAAAPVALPRALRSARSTSSRSSPQRPTTPRSGRARSGRRRRYRLPARAVCEIGLRRHGCVPPATRRRGGRSARTRWRAVGLRQGHIAGQGRRAGHVRRGRGDRQAHPRAVARQPLRGRLGRRADPAVQAEQACAGQERQVKLHLGATCAESAKLLLARGSRNSAIAQPIAAGAGLDSLQSAAVLAAS